MKTRILLLIIFFTSVYLNGYSANCSLNAGVDQTVCTGTATLTGDYSGSFPASRVTIWSQVSGPSATITSPSSLVTTVTGLVGGNVYRFRLSSTCEDGSATYDEVTVTVESYPTANAGADMVICTGNPAGTLAAGALASGQTGVWTIISGSSGLTINNTASPTSTVRLTAGTSNTGTAVLRWTVTSTATGCTAYDEVTLTKIALSPISAGADQNLNGCFNSTTSTTLAGSWAGGGTGGSVGTWSVVSGPNTPSITNVNLYNTGISNLIEGVYILRWTVSGPCLNGSDDVQIAVSSEIGAVSTPSASISGYSNGSTLCTTPSQILLQGSAYNTSTEDVLWSKYAGPASINIESPTSQNTIVTGFDGVTTTQFTYKITNKTTSCTRTSGIITLYFEAGQTVAITSANPLVLDCNATSTTVAITQTGTTQAQWSVVSGPTGLTSYTSLATNATSFSVTGLTLPGTYLVRIRKSVGNCTTIYKDLNIVVSKSPTASNAGSDQTLACNVSSGELIGNTPTVGTGKWSQLSGPTTATLATPTASRCAVTGLTNGVYTFRWTITAGPKCTVNQNDVSITVASTSPTVANAGTDQDICNSTPLYLSANSPQVYETGTWTVTPSTGITFSNTHSPTATVTGLSGNTTYTFTWTIANACGSSADNVIVHTSATVGPIAALAGSDQCLASGTTSATLAGNNPSPGTGTWRQLTGAAATITSPNTYNSTVTGLSNGTYTFEWSIVRNECTTTRDTMIITISGAATTANAGSDQLTICGTTATMAANTPTVGVGTWSQVSGPGGATITSPNSGSTTITGLTDGQYIFRWTISNGACSSNSDDVMLFVSSPPTTPNAGVDKVLCGTAAIAMTANTIVTGSGYWNIVSGPNIPTITTNTSPVTTVTGLITGEPYVLTWNSTNGLCTTLTDTVLITVIPNASAGSSQTICGATTVSLTGNVNTTGTWTQELPAHSTEVITATSTYSAVVTGLIPNTKYRFKYTLANAGSCSSVTDTMTVDVKAAPNSANAGADISECIATASTTITVTGNNPDAGLTGRWARVSGPAVGTITSATSATTTITGLTPGIYTFSWTISNGACSSVDYVTVAISSVVLKSAGPDQAVCGTTATMAAEAPSSGVGTWSQVSGPNTANFASSISNTTTVTGLINGTYVFRWTITDGDCSGVYDDVSVAVSSAPTTPNAGSDQSVCNLSTFTMAGNAITTGTGTWSKISGPSCTITNVNSPTTTVTGVTPGTYVFQWTATNGNCTTLYDQMTITNYNPTTTANAGSDFHACLYAPLNLEANSPVYGSGLWSQISGNAITFTAATSPTTSITGAIAGTYVFRWTISNGSCSASSDDVTVVIDEPTTSADAGPNQTVTNNYTTMSANAIAVGTGMWTKISGPTGGTITSPTSPTTTVTDLSSGTYVFRWTATNISCSSYDEVTIVYNGVSCIISNKMIQHKLK